MLCDLAKDSEPHLEKRTNTSSSCWEEGRSWCEPRLGAWARTECGVWELTEREVRGSCRPGPCHEKRLQAQAEESPGQA